ISSVLLIAPSPQVCRTIFNHEKYVPLLRCCVVAQPLRGRGLPASVCGALCVPLVLLMPVFLFGCLCCEASAGSGWGLRCKATPPPGLRGGVALTGFRAAADSS
ncbi:MAG: hypothetical protein ABI865_12825, partial [Nitrosospira sp.]